MFHLVLSWTEEHKANLLYEQLQLYRSGNNCAFPCDC